MSGKTDKSAARLADKYLVISTYLVLAIVTFIAYHWTLRNDFINFDDDKYVTENQHVRSGLNRDSIFWAFGFTKIVYWMPLTWLSHSLDCQLFGLKAGMHHLTSLLIHIANTLLLFAVFKRMTGALWKSAFVAALFALHPVNVDSVAWTAERKNVLSTFFWMLTMLAYIYYTERPSVSRYLLIIAAFVFGLLSKPMLVTLPFALLLLDYWPLGRISNIKYQISKLRNGINLILEKLPLFVLTAVSTYLSSISFKDPYSQAVPIKLRTGNALVSYIKYISKLIWPADLAVFYPYPSSVSAWQVVGSLLLLVCVSATVILLMKKKPYLLTGWLWYTGTLVPVLGLVQIGLWPAMADRWAYVPLIGIFIMIAWGADELLTGRRWRETALGASAATVLFALSICTSFQLRYWQNSVALFEHTLRVTSNNYLAHNNLGVAYIKLGRYDEAAENCKQAIRIKPNYAKAYDNLGVAYFLLGRYNEAVENCKQAIEIRPNYAEAYNDLGTAYGGLGRYNEAIEQYKQAIRIKPDYAEAQYNLGTTYGGLGRYAEAIEAYKQTIKIRPNYTEAYNNLGTAYGGLGRYNEAIEQYKQAVRIKPDYAGAQYNLGTIYNGLGRYAEAIEAYKQTIKIRPNYAEAYNNLGTAYDQLGQHNEAIEAYKQAVKIKPDLAEAYYNLGMAYLVSDDRGSALEEYKILKSLNEEMANKLFSLIYK